MDWPPWVRGDQCPLHETQHHQGPDEAQRAGDKAQVRAVVVPSLLPRPPYYCMAELIASMGAFLLQVLCPVLGETLPPKRIPLPVLVPEF